MDLAGIPDSSNPAPSQAPMDLFLSWAREAAGVGDIPMTLSTVDEQGAPWSRLVLLKAADHTGFSFYTNLGSPKARHLASNPRAALCFHWPAQGRQVRVQGRAEPVTAEEADQYFATRPRLSQIGAWASRQSQPLSDRSELETRMAEFDEKFAGSLIPRPPFWSGFRVIPESIEFWQERPHRLHDRILYRRAADGWTVTRLYP